MIDRELARAARRFADNTSARLNDIVTARVVYLTVSGTSPLTVTWRGANVLAAAKSTGYTPTVGDRVLCLHGDDGQLTVCFAVA